MATYNNDLRLKEITPGDEDGVWGGTTNTNWSIVAEAWSTGTLQLAADANETFTMADGATSQVRAFYITVTSAGTLTATRTLTLAPSTLNKVWFIKNSTTGGQSIIIKQGSGATVTIANGSVTMLSTDGAGAGAAVTERPIATFGTMATQNANAVAITGGSITGITDLAVADGGTGASTAAAARTNLGSTTVGDSYFTLANPGAITFPRMNANNTVSSLTAADFRTAIGSTTVGDSFYTLSNPGAITFPRMNANNTVTALSASDFRSAIGAGTGAGTVTSVSGTGSASGLSLSGTVTTTGSLTLSGTVSVSNSNWSGTDLAVANGGTGASDADTARANLGIGSMAMQNSSSVSITGGTITGVTVGLGAVSPTISAGTLTIDLSLGSVFYVAVSQNFEVDVISPPDGRPVPFTIIFTNSGSWDVTGITMNSTTVYGWSGVSINLKPLGRTYFTCMYYDNKLDVFRYWMDVVP